MVDLGIIHGDCRAILPKFVNQIDLIITSPPYADARKHHYDSINPDDYPDWFAQFHEPFWNALKPNGSLVINIKDKIVNGVRHRYVWRTIDKLTSLGWLCVDDYIWHKKTAMPGYWPNRLRDCWEYCFHLSKQKRPYMNQDAVRVRIGDWADARLKSLSNQDKKRNQSSSGSGFGRNISQWKNKTTVLPGNVLYLSPETKNQQHPAVFPEQLPEFFIKLLCPEDGVVADPFAGSGTTGIAAAKLNRKYLLIDNQATYCEIALSRLQNVT